MAPANRLQLARRPVTQRGLFQVFCVSVRHKSRKTSEQPEIDRCATFLAEPSSVVYRRPESRTSGPKRTRQHKGGQHGGLSELTVSVPMIDSIRVNVTTLTDDGQVSREQVVLNITYEAGQVYVNDFPVNNGVTRISCQTVIVKNENLEEKEYSGIIIVRILVHEWPMTSASSLQLIVIQEEVVEIDGRQAQQKNITEIDILVKNQGLMLRHSNYTLPLEESMLYSISRDNDVVFTLPNLSRKVDSGGSLQTTSQYLIRNVETTIDEDALPGKLPETPLRAEPPSSYKVMCQWMEKFRKDLCWFWSRVFPIIFMFLNVFVVGIIGAAVVITILKILFPVCEHKGVLQLDKISVIPVAAVSLYPDGPEKTAANLEDKTCI
ncbi:PREDICTED: glycoprotein integral membrane protein 1 [Chrysochloris asiatica]|uniref:Glycoprotein integral membrane protein 1 n=1 Tax=Chrysochloris asiatica TaxID=185453 RepID=A0A9B0U3W8_CHRAS|nr:PREDICTED: glycoprotein integral membrane protein 1 [Chrysochloris asiatica]